MCVYIYVYIYIYPHNYIPHACLQQIVTVRIFLGFPTSSLQQMFTRRPCQSSGFVQTSETTKNCLHSAFTLW